MQTRQATIRHWAVGLALGAALVPATARAAVTQDSFLVRTTSDLVDLCTAPSADPMYTAASNFCHGFTVGVYRVVEEEERARRNRLVFCPPSPGPSRSEAIAGFTVWAKANPDQLTKPPADGVVAYMISQYPCTKKK
ncbi:Rap1a/Tai family immunity protein [Limobrevibacterium gyesilva]|uniref:Rap1a/Tai family immunity protein n=1 Tax=Limobrevibacterium gyesilva TaxID=2991712 RepID=A0AA42CG44_9PROT|nr:Rap1a/Tai family immunity protein [Limobrevibacterium gyesilva]MCW3477319.1 Rap1a/Tai family immunity protein [Limobrevibacterium gyesilva]